MKNKTITFLLLLACSNVAYCKNEPTTTDYLIDAVFYRPFGVLATIIGTAGVVATLPTSLVVSAIDQDNSVIEVTQEFVIEPAKATFSRPFGMPLEVWHASSRPRTTNNTKE